MKKPLEDLMTFGKVISAGLLICGYVVLGLILGNKLVEKGHPDWLLFILPLIGALTGIWQGWVWLKKIWKQ